jgi:hypothetical protein
MSKPAKRVALSFTAALVCLALTGTAHAYSTGDKPASSVEKPNDVDKMSAPKTQTSPTEKKPLEKKMEGQIPPPTIDSNEDGKLDAWDRDANGVADAWDVNGDGKPDVMDNDGDGRPDEGKSPPPKQEGEQPR